MGELAFAPPTSSPVVPCPSATGPTSIATVKGASHPSAEPSVLPGDACGTALPPAEGQRVRSPDMPSQGSTTSPSGPLLRRCRPSARCFVWPRGREKRPSPRGYSCQQNHSFRTGMPVPTFPPLNGQGVGRPMRHGLQDLRCRCRRCRDSLPRCCRPPARCSVWPRGREERPSPRGHSRQPNHSFRLGMPVPTFPPLTRPRGRSPDVPSSSGSVTSLST